MLQVTVLDNDTTGTRIVEVADNATVGEVFKAVKPHSDMGSFKVTLNRAPAGQHQVIKDDSSPADAGGHRPMPIVCITPSKIEGGVA